MHSSSKPWQQAGVRQQGAGTALGFMAAGLLRTTNSLLRVLVLLGVLGAAALEVSNLEEVDVILGSRVDVPLQWASSVSLHASVLEASFMTLRVGDNGSAGSVGVDVVTNSSACPSPNTALSIIVVDEAGAEVGAGVNVMHTTPQAWEGGPSRLQQTLHAGRIVQATSRDCLWKAGTMVFQLSIHDASVLEAGSRAVARGIGAAMAGLTGGTEWGVVIWWLPGDGERILPCGGGRCGAAPLFGMTRHGAGGRLLAESGATANVAAAAASMLASQTAPIPQPFLSAMSSKDAGPASAAGARSFASGGLVGAAALRKQHHVVTTLTGGPNGSEAHTEEVAPSQVSAATASAAGIPSGDQIGVQVLLYGYISYFQTMTYSLVLDGRRIGLCQSYPTLAQAWTVVSYSVRFSCDAVKYGNLCRTNVFFYDQPNFGGREVDLSQQPSQIQSFRVCIQMPHWNSVRPLGCFSDSLKRTISWQVVMSGSPATFWKCYRVAYALGMRMFSLQAGAECYVGLNATEAMSLGFVNSSSNGGQTSPISNPVPGASQTCTGCNMACQADPTQRCGGYAQNQIYQVLQPAPDALYLFLGPSMDGYTAFLSCPFGYAVTSWIITTGRPQGSWTTVVADIAAICSDGTSVGGDNSYSSLFSSLDASTSVPVGTSFTAGGGSVLTNFMGVGTPSTNQRNLNCGMFNVANLRVSGLAYTRSSGGIQALVLHCNYPNLLAPFVNNYLVLPTSAPATYSIWPVGGNLTVATLANCQLLCDLHFECEYVSYNTATGVCVPQSGLPGLGWEASTLTNTVTMPLRGNTIVGAKNMSSGAFYYIVGIGLPSWDVAFLVDDVYACQAACESLVSGCVAFAHQSQLMGAMGECMLLKAQSSPLVVTAVKYRGLARCDGKSRCPPGLCCSKKNGLCGAGYDYCGAACEGSNNRYCSPGRSQIGETCGLLSYTKSDGTFVVTTQYCGDGLCCGGSGSSAVCGVGASYCLANSGCRSSFGTCVNSLSSTTLVPVAQCSNVNLYLAYCKGTGCTAIPEFVQGEKRDSTWIATMVEVKCCTMFNQCFNRKSASGGKNICQFGPRSIGGGLWLYIFDTVAGYEVVCDPWWSWWWWWG